MKIWTCKIGGATQGLPMAADERMREAVERAYRELTGVDAEFTLSGWDGTLTVSEAAAEADREPDPADVIAECDRVIADALEMRASAEAYADDLAHPERVTPAPPIRCGICGRFCRTDGRCVDVYDTGEGLEHN